MSHYLVMGAGKIGVVLAKDLIESGPGHRVSLVDIDGSRLDAAARCIGSDRLSTELKNMEDDKERESVIRGKDVVLNAMLHRHSLPALMTAVRCGTHFVDLVGEAPIARKEYDQEARRNGVIAISGVGVSPGITNICVGRAVFLLDETHSARIYCGGNPVQPRPPLSYRIVYSIDSLLNFYQRPAVIIRNGRTEEVPALSEVEAIGFGPDFPEMECFFTDGLSSLFNTMRGRIHRDLYEKTVRHRGHAEGFKTLIDCGLFSREPISVAGMRVVPREVLESLLEERMKLRDESDVTLLRIVVEGLKSGRAQRHTFEMIDYFDQAKRFTSMAKTTGFPASIAAQMIATGRIVGRGSLFPENVFDRDLYPDFMEALRKRGVLISHSVVSD